MNAMDRKDRVPTAQADLPETDLVAIANLRLLAIEDSNEGTINH